MCRACRSASSTRGHRDRRARGGRVLEASHVQSEIFRAVGANRATSSSRRCLRLRRQRRHSSVRRIDDARGAPVHEVTRAGIPPIGAGRDSCIRLLTLDILSFVRGGLFFGQDRFVAEIRGTLDRRECGLAQALARNRDTYLARRQHITRPPETTSLNDPALSQQSHRSPLTRAPTQQRISRGRALNDLTRPLVVARKLHANCEICTALNQ